MKSKYEGAAAVAKAAESFENLPSRQSLGKIDMKLLQQWLLERGWVMIPIEPTPADIHAMAREMPQHGTQRIYVKRVYDALVRERSR